MFEQDYVMRLIKEMVRAILKLLFQMDTQSPTAELLENEEENEQTDDYLEANDFPRGEIKMGLEYVTSQFGLSSIAKTFLMDI